MSGCKAWMAAPLAKPATIMSGNMRRTSRANERSHAAPPVRSTSDQVAASAATAGSSHASSAPARWSRRAPRRRTAHATRGPSESAATSPSTSRLAPRRGVKTTAIISSDGTFSVADPCTRASAPSTPRPPRRSVLDTGATQAEQRLSTGPRPMPFRMRRQRPGRPSKLDGPARTVTSETRNASAMAAAANANNIPTATSCR